MSNELATTDKPFVKAFTSLSTMLGVEPSMMIETIKKQCFRNLNADQVSDAQLAAFVSVANSLKVNPLLPGFLYAYPERNGGITPIIGPDGMYKMLAEHPDIASWDTVVYPEDPTMPATHAKCSIWRKGVERPITYTALRSEWEVKTNPNWNSRPRHMLQIRAMKQAARQLIHGIPMDEDERQIGEINVTPGAPASEPTAEPTPKRRQAAPRSEKGVAAVKENAKPAEAPIDVPATPVAEQPTPVAAPEPTPPPTQEKAPEPAAPVAEPAKPAGPIADGERRSAVVQVLEVECKAIMVVGVLTPCVKAKVKGDHNGDVWHLNGATKAANGSLNPNPLWKVGTTVRLGLLGKLNTTTKVVAATVEKIEAVEQTQAEF